MLNKRIMSLENDNTQVRTTLTDVTRNRDQLANEIKAIMAAAAEKTDNSSGLLQVP